MSKVFIDPLEIQKMFAKKNLPNNFCIVPFTNLIFNPGGKVGVCRQKGTDHCVGHLKDNSIEEIRNSDFMRQWRSEFLSGNVKICAAEQSQQACHLSASNYHFFEETDFSEVQNHKILKITANFNGQCNLQCKMCHIWEMENGYYDQINFWEDAETKIFPFIKELEMLSGEPFIQKDTYKLIDKISAVNSDCLWAFTTNAQWKLSSFIKDKLDKIKVKNIIISLDSLDEKRFSEIRKKGSLKFLLNTLNELILYRDQRLKSGLSDLGLTIHFLGMRDNFFDVFEIIDLCEEKNIRHCLRALQTPENFSVLSLGYNDRLKLLEKFIDQATAEQLKKSMRLIAPVIHSLEPIDKVFHFVKIKNSISVEQTP